VFANVSVLPDGAVLSVTTSAGGVPVPPRLVPIWTSEPLEKPEMADTVTAVVPAAYGPDVRVVDEPEDVPVVVRSPNMLSNMKPSMSRYAGPPRLNVDDAGPSTSLNRYVKLPRMAVSGRKMGVSSTSYDPGSRANAPDGITAVAVDASRATPIQVR
jgi:hypothetical protein